MSRRPAKRFFSRRAGVVLLGALALFVGSEATENAQANGDTRSLTLYHTHRGDTTTITFKRNGRYDAEGLKQLSYFLRDWRNNKQTRMEPRLFDIVWEVHRQVGRGGMINIVSSYRSPETNAYLRSHSQGVAKFSQHMLGRAMDFYITGVPVSSVREAGMRLQRGGVGFYPTSGRPFVHLDAGNVRAWPRMTRTQLVKLFPDGKTVHVPADGKPLPGYQVAMAELKSRGSVSVADAYAGGSSGKSFFARLFGGADEGDDAETSAPTTAVAGRAPAPASSDDDEGGAAAAVAAASAPAAVKVATVRVPMPSARPSDMGRSAPAVAQEVVATASIPLPPVAPTRLVEASVQVSSANIPLPPVAPIASAPVPTPAPAYNVASAEPAPAPNGPDMVWQTGAQPAGQVQASAGLALASAVPTPRPRPTADTAVAVLAALPTPASSSSSEGATPKRQIDPQVATAYQAEAASFPRLPDAFSKKPPADDMKLAYASPQDLQFGAAATRVAVAPQTRVTATAPQDPNVRVLSPYSTPSAVYAAVVAPQRKRATLSAPEGMVTAHMDSAALRAAATPVPATKQNVMIHPDQVHVASLFSAPHAALVGGFGADPSHGARSDRFSGSSVMLLRTQSFMPTTYAGGSSHG
jgi:uncharacterized protein YcbK (DUF882 family)